MILSHTLGSGRKNFPYELGEEGYIRTVKAEIR